MSDRAVIVTGGSRGLGAALVEGFLAQGDRVATCSRRRSDRIEAWATEPSLAGRFLYAAFDMSDRRACASFVAEVVRSFGTVDVLVNNAGLARASVLALVHDDDVDEVVDLNLKATIEMTRIVVRRMLPKGTGRIVNVSSIVGLTGYRGLAVYGATKAAIDGLTRALAREVGPRGITVNSVAPGYLRTEMSHGLDASQLDQIVRRTPAGRLGEPEDVVRAVLFLAAPEADFLTGHVLVIDGGLTA